MKKGYLLLEASIDGYMEQMPATPVEIKRCVQIGEIINHNDPRIRGTFQLSFEGDLIISALSHIFVDQGKLSAYDIGEKDCLGRVIPDDIKTKFRELCLSTGIEIIPAS